MQEIREIYGLIHKRFIQTQIGLGLVREKFLDGVYGSCPRLLCNKQVLLPVGLSEDARYSQVKVFCPLCQEVYKPRDIYYGYQGGKKIYKFDLPDGIFFGTSFIVVGAVSLLLGFAFPLLIYQRNKKIYKYHWK